MMSNNMTHKEERPSNLIQIQMTFKIVKHQAIFKSKKRYNEPFIITYSSCKTNPSNNEPFFVIHLLGSQAVNS